jgi:carbonic anhydrase
MIRRLISFVGIFIILTVSAVLGEEAGSLNKLLDGNKRFIAGNLESKDFSDTKRKELAKGQRPFAIVVACSDSRVAPEIIFDQGLGDIFVIRVAGNVLDQVSLGSIEYAAEHLKTPLVIILGHTYCGAVTAAVESKGRMEGNIGAIVKRILPAVERAKKEGKSGKDLLNSAIVKNVLLQREYMIKNSPVIRKLIKSKELQVITAIYNLESGEVSIVN